MNTKLLFGIGLLFVLMACLQTEKLAQPSPEKFKIGLIAPLSGSQAIYGQWAQKGVSFALEKLDNIEVVYEDSQCDPKAGLSAFNKLVDVDGVKAIISNDCSSPTLAYAPIANQKGILLLASASVAPALADVGDYVFRIRYTAEDDGAALAKLAHVKNWKKAAILRQETDAGVAYANEFEKRFSGTITIVAKESYPLSATDFRTQLTKIKASDPDVLLVFTQGDLGSGILKQIRELGINASLMSSGTNFPPKVIEAAGNTAEGLYATFPIFEIGSYDAAEAFKKVYQSRFNESPSYFVATSYDAVNMLSKAALNCNNDVNCMQKSIAQTKNYAGVSSSITFDTRGELVGTELGIKQIQNGKFVKVE